MAALRLREAEETKGYRDGPENAEVKVVRQSIPICTMGWTLLLQRLGRAMLL
jgi:hypothetical protein